MHFTKRGKFFPRFVFLIKRKQFLKQTKTREAYNILTKYNARRNDKMKKIADVNEKIAENVVGGYKKIEDGVVGGYKKIEKGAVDGFNKVSDKIIEKVFAKEGETVEDAKKRLRKEEK